MALQSDEEYWTEQAWAKARSEQETVQKAATAWASLFTAMLGIFGTVMFAGGLPALEDLAQPLRTIVQVIVLLAVVSALTATIYASTASGAAAKTTDDTSWQGVRRNAREAAANARRHLRKAKVWGVAAAVLVVGGSILVLFAGPAAPGPPNVIAVVNGDTVCGRISKDAGGGLRAGNTSLAGATSVTVVSACP